MRKLLALLLITLISCKESEEISQVMTPALVTANGGDNSLSFIDPNTMEEKQRIYLKAPRATYLHHLGLSPQADKIALAFPEYDFSEGHDGLHNLQVQGHVSVWNKASNKLENTYTVPYANHNAVFSPDGKEIWTGLVSHSGRILVHSALDGSQLATITVGADPHEILFANEGRYVVVTCLESSFLTVIDAQTKKVIRDIKVDPFPTNVWPGRDTYHVIVENSTQKTINIIDLRSFQVIDHLDLDFAPGYSAFDEEGNLWICTKGQNYLRKFSKADGSWKEIQKIETHHDPHQFLIFASKLWLVNQKQNTVQIIDLKTGDITGSISVGLKPNAIIYMP